ncbi:SDR family NAD(P)-dependent oxidoreductase [Micromonospora sp. FIMYZ51]|uniref:SDR family NAD(P)-dependent oxidoreductase n=1 Tax=Micromonospora sp. FIMYZ51 TaxID=3051832 RepID=UPI00312011A6
MRALEVRAPHEVPVAAPRATRPYRWTVIGPAGHPAAAALHATSDSAAPAATAVLLGRRFRPADNARLLTAVTRAGSHGGRLALLHLGAGGGSLLRAAAVEDPRLSVVVVELTGRGSPAAVRAAVAAAAGDPLDAELHVDDHGRFTSTAWRTCALPAEEVESHPGSVLVTGGLGGLGLRAAAVLACRRGLHPILVDTADPGELGPAARRHLTRLAVGGVTLVRADVTDGPRLRRALDGVTAAVPTVLVHCAGLLRGGPVAAMTPSTLHTLQRVKSDGLRNVIEALPQPALRQVVVYGSITAERPHRSLGAYALANELLRRTAERHAADLPRAAVVVAEWSLWSGAGMAHGTPGAVAAARRMGMAPVPVGPGTAALDALLRLPATPGTTTRLLLTGQRTG